LSHLISSVNAKRARFHPAEHWFYAKHRWILAASSIFRLFRFLYRLPRPFVGYRHRYHWRKHLPFAFL
jgi:hypothetical protein